LVYRINLFLVADTARFVERNPQVTRDTYHKSIFLLLIDAEHHNRVGQKWATTTAIGIMVRAIFGRTKNQHVASAILVLLKLLSLYQPNNITSEAAVTLTKRFIPPTSTNQNPYDHARNLNPSDDAFQVARPTKTKFPTLLS